MIINVLLALTVLLFLRYWWRRLKYDVHKIPTPPGLPLLGNMLSIAGLEGASELTRFRGRWWKAFRYPKIMKLDILGLSIVVVRDAHVTKNLLTASPPFPKILGAAKYTYLLAGSDPKIEMLFACPRLTPYSKGIRNIYAKWLQSQNLKRLLPKMDRVVSIMMDRIEERREDGPIDFQKLSLKTILDVIGVASFDTNLGGLDNSRQLYRLLIEGGYVLRALGFNPIKALAFKWFPRLPWVEEHVKSIDALTDVWRALVDEILTRDESHRAPDDFLYQLKTFVDPVTQQPLSYEYFLGECATVVIGGMDTTGHQLAWILALMAAHPPVVAKLRAQLSEVCLYGKGARNICFEDFGDLTYLTAIIKEGMRVASVIPGSFSRVTPHDMTILGYRLPKGTVISAPANRWLDADDEWENPLSFRPERWLSDDDMKSKYFFGFSFGQRDCPGQKLAMLDMRLVIVQLFKKYDLVSTVPYEELSKNTRLGLAVEAKDGIWLRVTPISETSTNEARSD